MGSVSVVLPRHPWAKSYSGVNDGQAKKISCRKMNHRDFARRLRGEIFFCHLIFLPLLLVAAEGNIALHTRKTFLKVGSSRLCQMENHLL
jgi:hypothetical protein